MVSKRKVLAVMRYAYPYLLRRGLCNMLFTWAQAVSYCYNQNAKMIAPVWTRLTRIGPLLRGERYKRYYGGEFTNNGYVSGIRRWWLLHFNKGSIRTFRGMDGFFDPFIKNQKIIKEELSRIIAPSILLEVQRIVQEEPYVGVHVRRGDFVVAGLLTPDEWYIRAIEAALKSAADQGVDIHTIRVFTDGYPDEVAFISKAFMRHKVVVMKKAPAIQDVLAMSNAVILVCTADSTFSMWAVFLGQIPSVWRKGCRVPNLYLGEGRCLFV